MIHLLLLLLLFAAFCLYQSKGAIRQMHMFQLNSYRVERYGSWLKVQGAHLFSLRQAVPLLAVLLFLLPEVCLPLGGALLYLVLFFTGDKTKAKKPLVYTARVKRMFATLAALHLLLFALLALLPFWAVVIGLVVMDVCCPLLILLANLVNHPMEQAINRYYYKDAQKKLAAMPNLIVIGVTGSYGKTSTKYILHRLLSAKYNVLMTPESYNTPMGVIRTVRSSLNATHEIFIVEMGAKNIGDIKEICDLVHPKYGVISSIGPQHLETFGSIENVIKTKFELADALPKDGAVFLNFDNEYIKNRTVSNCQVVSYGTMPGADVVAKDIAPSPQGSDFTITAKGTAQPFHTRLLGRLNVTNIAAATAVATFFGVRLSDLTVPVRMLEPVPHRLALVPGGRYTIIDDAFNSNPMGAAAAVETLGGFDGFRVLVTPGMVELGSKQEELNRAFGAQAAQNCDFIILVGEKQAAPLREGVLSSSFPQENLYVAKDLTDALAKVNEITRDNTVVLLENDLPDNFL